MRTILVSDLHLGTRSGSDLVRRPQFAELVAGACEGADQVILLGDVVELRDRPLSEVLEIAGPLFERLGEAVGDGRIVVVPGNHDHQLLAPWLERRRLRGAGPLGLEQTAKANAGALGSLSRKTGKAETILAYPGIWVRDDVYATHGHYLDAHLTVPTFERLGVGVVERLSGASAATRRTPDDYEAVQAPLYSFLYTLAQGARTRRATGSNASARVWQTVHGRDGRPPTLAGRVAGRLGVPGAVSLANRLGIGPLRADLSAAEIGRAGVRAMAEVVRNLRIEAAHVVFGHTHRSGPHPMPRGAASAEPSWSVPGGPRLTNVGSWVYAPGILGHDSSQSQFWPGTVGVLDDEGEPRLLGLLDEHGHDELRPRKSSERRQAA
jgi:Calcineurin-like phosphoesterase